MCTCIMLDIIQDCYMHTGPEESWQVPESHVSWNIPNLNLNHRYDTELGHSGISRSSMLFLVDIGLQSLQCRSVILCINVPYTEAKNEQCRNDASLGNKITCNERAGCYYGLYLGLTIFATVCIVNGLGWWIVLAGVASRPANDSKDITL